MRKWLIILIILVATVWGGLYYYIGFNVDFLKGYVRSLQQQPATLSVTSGTPSVVDGKRFVGFSTAVIHTGLSKPTRMAFEPGTNDLIISQLDGAIIRFRLDGERQIVASGFRQLLGISFERIGVPEGKNQQTMLTAARGTVQRLTRQTDGTYGSKVIVLENLPAGRHQTDLALAHPITGDIYVATGSRSDRGELGINQLEAAIIKSDYEGVEHGVFAKGLRNPYGMAFDGEQLLVTDNGQDVPASGVPDELNLVEKDKNYGWPLCYGRGGGSCAGTEAPIALLQEHSSANGFAVYDGSNFPPEYKGNVFIALWGANSKDPDIGKRIVRVIRTGSPPYTVEDFITGLDNPIDVKVDPRDGSLLILDYGSGEVLKVSARYE